MVHVCILVPLSTAKTKFFLGLEQYPPLPPFCSSFSLFLHPHLVGTSFNHCDFLFFKRKYGYMGALYFLAKNMLEVLFISLGRESLSFSMALSCHVSKHRKKGRTKNVSAFDIFFPLLSSKVI